MKSASCESCTMCIFQHSARVKEAEARARQAGADAERAKHELDAQRERNRRERECAKQVQYALGKLHSNVSADDVVKVVQVINQAHA